MPFLWEIIVIFVKFEGSKVRIEEVFMDRMELFSLPYVDPMFFVEVEKRVRIEDAIVKIFNNCQILGEGNVLTLTNPCPYERYCRSCGKKTDGTEPEPDEWQFDLEKQSFKLRCHHKNPYSQEGRLIQMGRVWLSHYGWVCTFYPWMQKEERYTDEDSVFEILDRLRITHPGPLGEVKCPRCEENRLVPLRARDKWDVNFFCWSCLLCGRYDGEQKEEDHENQS
jgi:hypothetical protein